MRGKLLFGSLLIGCTPTSQEWTEPADPVTPQPAPEPDPEPEPEAGGCEPRFDLDPHPAASTGVELTPLREAATFSAKRTAIGAYDHSVAFDDAGSVVWAHDSRHWRFKATKFDAQGAEQWSRVLEPPELSPNLLATTTTGGIFIAGTSFAEDEKIGPSIIRLNPAGGILWRVGTPRVRPSSIWELSDGRFLIVGHSGKQDVVSVLDRDGRFQRTHAYLTGINATAMVDDELFAAGNFGHQFVVDYGGGPTAGPGVLAKISADGRHRWSRSLPTGLHAAVAQGDDVMIVGFADKNPVSMGGPDVSGIPVAWFNSDGCYRGSASLGDGIGSIAAGPDGSFLAYWLPVEPGQRTVGNKVVTVRQFERVFAKFNADLELLWLHSIFCDNATFAAGAGDRAAVSCMKEVPGPKTRRSYELFVRG